MYGTQFIDYSYYKYLHRSRVAYDLNGKKNSDVIALLKFGLWWWTEIYIIIDKINFPFLKTFFISKVGRRYFYNLKIVCICRSRVA
jgi:hypothetical protein